MISETFPSPPLPFTTYIYLLFLVAVQSKARVCSHLLAGIAGLIPTGVWMSFLLTVVCC
jgi:hypothetical protein